MKLTPGSRWKSAVCDTEVVVMKAPPEGELACGGSTMLAMNASRPTGGTVTAGQDGGTLLGKRYIDDARGVELLCTRGGTGSLTFDGQALTIKATVLLPSSD